MNIVRGVKNQEYRDHWVQEKLHECVGAGIECLDVGAGQQPYRQEILSLGGGYTAQDFGEYEGNDFATGLNSAWELGNTDIISDILEIPEDRKFDLILCTEVLEHVPDPVRALEKLTRLTHKTPGRSSRLLLTAPRLSLSHQAPFHFATGLSPFFYEKWLPVFGFEIVELTLHGDWADFFAQEIRRFLRLPGLTQIPITHLIRPFTSRKIIDSAGFSVFVLARSTHE